MLSPALPSELLVHILNFHRYPTTLIVCSPKTDFLVSLARDVRQQTSPANQRNAGFRDDVDEEGTRRAAVVQNLLLSAPLYQVAVSRHIRIVFVPTVVHLRAYLSVFSPHDAKVPKPPTSEGGPTKPPLLLVYGFLELHHDTSEWSAQGLGTTAAALVEAAWHLSLKAVIVERYRIAGGPELSTLLSEPLPILSGSARRVGPDVEEIGWTGRTVGIKQVLGRWFKFQAGGWDADRPRKHESDTTTTGKGNLPAGDGRLESG